MKILIAMNGFYPAKNYGGPVVSIENFTNLLGDDFECYIITKDIEFGSNEKLKGIKKGWNDIFKAKVSYYSKNEFNYNSFKKIVNQIKPDLIYINSFFSYNILFPFIKISKKYKIPILLAPRGELCQNALKMKKLKKISYINVYRMFFKNKYIYYQSTSEEETQAIIKYFKTDVKRIFNLSNIPTISKIDKLENNKKSGYLNAIFVSRIHPKKNLHFLIDCLRKVKGTVNLDIYGPKEDMDYWNMINKKIGELPNNIHVSYCRNLDHEEIIPTMSKYDCFLFYTLSENYGHVIAEAINALCIPILSNTTPWNDIELYKAGLVANLDDEKKCIDNIQKMIDIDDKGLKIMINNLRDYKTKKINNDRIKNQYYKAIKSICEKRR